MIYALIYLIAALLLTGCNKEEVIDDKVIPEGYIPISLYFSAPDAINVNTRAADPDGRGVNKMNLFCFDNYGVFITHVDNVTITSEATNNEGYTLSGSINEVLVPENTRRIHFIANQNTTSFEEENFSGKTEQEVIAKLEGSSGMIIYWGYFAAYGSEISDAQTFIKKLKEAHGSAQTPIRLLRNQARFEVPSRAGIFSVTGFTVVNTSAFGTIAPYHPEKGFNFKMLLKNNGTEWDDCDWTDTDFITLPNNTVRISPPQDVDIAPETYVFETDNKNSDPVSIIIKGRNQGDAKDLYYRVILMDKQGNYIKIRRNHRYTINITGKLYYGQETFEQALTAPASNNVWLSISDEINEVTDNTWSLKVNETFIEILATPDKDNGGWILSKPYPSAQYDLNAPGGSILNYTVDLGYYLTKRDNSSVTAEDKPVVEWADGCEISTMSPINDFMVQESGNYNEVTVTLDNLGGLDTKQYISGSVVISKGLLQRKVNITILKSLDFTPVWISTQVNADAGENLTLLFTIPEECPDELLPFDVYISAANVDLRHIEGRELPVITYEGNPDEYGKDIYATQADINDGKPIGYKYVYTVTAKGDQRIYFHNLISRKDLNLTEWVTIESPLFNTVQKTIIFNASQNYRITMPGLKVSTSEDVYDENVKYVLVPQKKNAPVDLGLVFTQLTGDGNNKVENDIEVGSNDEFFLYSEYLSHLNGHGANTTCNCQFEDFNRDLWGSGGRIHAFRFKFPDDQNYTYGQDKGYMIHMITDKAKSEEIVRISSNQPTTNDHNSQSVFNQGSEYAGRGFRSLIFELENYRPFHFAARLNGSGTVVTGGNEEVVDNIELNYGPTENIHIDFDITSFKAEDGVSVDPFGIEFYVYIVAPMLDLAANTEKLIKLKDGVFAYKVGATRDAERESCVNNANHVNYSAGRAEIVDDIAGNDQQNERKRISFQKKNSVPQGEILLTTDPVLAGVSDMDGHSEQIAVFYDKRFKLSNKPITGTIQTQHQGSGIFKNMLDGAFVSFALERNNSRIGSIVIHAADSAHENKTWYELVLRPEYNFRWSDDNLVVTHTHRHESSTETFRCDTETRRGTQGEAYKFTLEDLSKNPNIVLVEQ